MFFICLFQILSVIFLIKQFGPISLVFVKPFSFQVVLFTVSECGSQLLEARKQKAGSYVDLFQNVFLVSQFQYVLIPRSRTFLQKILGSNILGSNIFRLIIPRSHQKYIFNDKHSHSNSVFFNNKPRH